MERERPITSRRSEHESPADIVPPHTGPRSISLPFDTPFRATRGSNENQINL